LPQPGRCFLPSQKTVADMPLLRNPAGSNRLTPLGVVLDGVWLLGEEVLVMEQI
jgi:hypothetical protein